MLYVSVDIETTGLDKDKHQVLSIGAIIEDTKLKLPYDQIPKFYGLILRREITGSPVAITMNKEIIELIGSYIEGKPEIKESMEEKYGKIFYEEDEIIRQLFHFLLKNGFKYPLDLTETQVKIDGKTKPITINVAGKNFGTFDKGFLQQLPWFQKLIHVRQRIIDPANSFVDWINDDTLPSLDECKKRAGIEGTVSHNALEDAWDVIQVLRKNY